MKLSQLSKSPELIMISLDDEDTVKQYGEPLEFYTLDRQPLDLFTRLAAVNQADTSEMIDLVRHMILDENGKEVIQGDQMIPAPVLIRAISKLVGTLGN